jgi:hypothetical protein
MGKRFRRNTTLQQALVKRLHSAIKYYQVTNFYVKVHSLYYSFN